MKPQEPPRPDSDAVKRALLPARIAHWRNCGAHVMADKLQAELDALESQAKGDTHENGA